jgi:hypothetical protein
MHRCLYVVLLAALTACSSSTIGVAPGAPTSPPNPVTGVSIPLGINTGNKAGYHLTISIGGAPARDVLLDTGSSGLWVYKNAIAKNGYRATKYVVSNSYGSGLEYTGILVYTHVDFGNGITTGEVPVALVTRAYCKDGSDCPADAGSKKYCPTVKKGPDGGVECLEAGRKLYGTFGADLANKLSSTTNAKAALYNVIFAIAQPWAHAFEVTPGALLVGEQPLAGYAIMPLPTASPGPQPMPNGTKPWQRDVTLCYTIAKLNYSCYGTLFDTGAHDVEFQADVDLPESEGSCGEQVTPGTPIVIQTFAKKASDSITIASFEAGDVTNDNRITTKKPKKSTPQVNTGMTLFNSNAIYYDAAKGIVAIHPLPKPVHVAQSGCGTD